ncbi:hypothetical protein [Nonomuraea sp. NPDC005692]|uniref:hypothetical protein n=1 Tax=Nonomuraea sp. NPDC005692 TaxID=3157168 RepID=UPI0033D5C166
MAGKRPHEGSDALQERQAEFEKFNREGMELAAKAIEASGMQGAGEAAAVMRRAYDAAGAQLQEGQKFCSSGGKTGGLGIGTGGEADVSAEKASGSSMLAAGSSKTQFGEGIDLGARLDAPQGLNQQTLGFEYLSERSAPGSDHEQHESKEGALSLSDKSDTSTKVPEPGLAARPAEPSANPEQIDSFRKKELGTG